MNNRYFPAKPNRANRSNTLRMIFGVLGGVSVLAVLCCGLIGFLIYHSVTRVATDIRKTAEQVKSDLEADRVEHRSRVDKNRLRDLVETAKARADDYKNRYEFCRKQFQARQRLVVDSPFPDFDANPTSGFLRAVREDPESFSKEFQIKDEYIPKLEAANSLEECQRVAVELEAKVLEIRKKRYRSELESLRASVAQQLGELDAEAYCVVEVTPPISEFAKAAHGAALASDLISGMWIASAANLGETPALPFSQWIRENAGQPRVAVVRKKQRAVDYIVESIFAENHFDGLSPAVCPWRLVVTSPDEVTAQAAAEQAASKFRAEQRRIREPGKNADPRPVIVVRVPDAN